MKFWDKPGRGNTEKTVELVDKTAVEKDYKYIVAASNEGDTVFKLLEQSNVDNYQIVCVTHHVGFQEDGKDEMSAETRQQLKKAGVKVYTATHLMAGMDRSLRKEYGGLYPPEVMANTLRMFSQGMKVCVEIAVMALDAGLVPYGEDIITIGGTGRGADTAAVIRPAHSNKIFETRIKEILCRPNL